MDHFGDEVDQIGQTMYLIRHNEKEVHILEQVRTEIMGQLSEAELNNLWMDFHAIMKKEQSGNMNNQTNFEGILCPQSAPNLIVINEFLTNISYTHMG